MSNFVSYENMSAIVTDINTKKMSASLKGVANGVAELDNAGKVPASQLPSYVDDVIEGYYYNGKFYEEAAHTTEITGETGKIYVDLATEETYRWSGTIFVKISDVDITGKADKVSGATNGNFAGLDSNGNLTDSGSKASDFLTSSDISGKADKVTSATENDLAKLNSNGNLADSGIAVSNVVTKSSTSGLIKNDGTIDTSDYATKVDTVTENDIAKLDANGNLADSGIAASNVVVKSNTAGLIKNDGTIDTTSYAAKVASATNGHLAALDATGGLTDSGKTVSDLTTTALTTEEVNALKALLS